MKKRNLSIVVIVLMLALVSVMLLGCVPKTADDANKSLKEKGYVAVIVNPQDLGAEAEDGVVSILTAVKVLEGEGLAAIWFDSRKSAKQNFDKYRNELENKVGISSLKNLQAGISGKCIFIGTPQAIKDFKKM